MTGHVVRADLKVAEVLAEFVEQEALPGSGIAVDAFWRGLGDLLRDLAPRNRRLLAVRDELQAKIDAYHLRHPGSPDPASYRAFLVEIGYLVAEPDEVSITTGDVDPEIRSQAGPQLVVPLLNARFAVNAANARWGSLYDALYGSDAIPDAGVLARGPGFNEHRAAEAVARGRRLLDLAVPLAAGSHADAVAYRVDGPVLVVELADSSAGRLAAPAAFVGYRGDPEAPTAVLLEHHGLHLEIVLDRSGSVGRGDAAGVQDLLLESAVTTIMDLEDSVAAVDADDKVLGYRNWHALMRGALSAEVEKNGHRFTRTLSADRTYTTPDGASLRLPGRSLLLVRNVGHLMTTDAVLDADGREAPEGILDAVMTALGALPDLVGDHRGTNSRTGSMYIVKPKMHGPDEVSFTVDTLSRVEGLLGLAPRTIKVGIMDEERRTSVNLAACIERAADRVVFINTGFLDRTGDEIHTSIQAGPVGRKEDLRAQPFIRAYEEANVSTGLHAGFRGRAQIGKGMWAMPDLMHAMLVQKIAHVRSGATAAWVPSPTAATLHALHYHHVDAFAVQAERMSAPVPAVEAMLAIPLAGGSMTPEQIATEVDNNVQSILGYVVRWVDQGIGCSKVLDIRDVALMEDRATLRISSQLLANWLVHGLVSAAAIEASLERLAVVVDRQNAGDPEYEPLIGPAGAGTAFEAARALIVQGARQPNGYTEPILHLARREKKAALARL